MNKITRVFLGLYLAGKPVAHESSVYVFDDFGNLVRHDGALLKHTTKD